jgi:hypothetical protein
VHPAELLASASPAIGVERPRGPTRVRREPRAVVLRSAEARPGEPEQWHERAAVAEDDRDAQGDPARVRQPPVEERVLPGLRHGDRETLAELARRLGLRPVLGVAVDRRGGGVHPQGGRPLDESDGLRDLAGRLDARAQDLGPVRRGVPAVDALPREVHDHGRTVEDLDDPEGVPPDRVPAAADRADVRALVAERLDEVPPDEAGRTGDDDARSFGHSVPPEGSASGTTEYVNAPSYRYSVPTIGRAARATRADIAHRRRDARSAPLAARRRSGGSPPVPARRTTRAWRPGGAPSPWTGSRRSHLRLCA